MRRGWRGPAAEDERSFEPRDVFAAGLRHHHVSNTAYPIAHERTWRPYRVAAGDAERVALEAWEGVGDLGVYVHVPFCEVRCSFCEYTVVRREEHGSARAYVDDLLAEIGLWRSRLGRRRALGFDIGGGTPSFLPAGELVRIVHAVRDAFDLAPGADLSVETTPKIAAAEPDKLRAWRAAGVDRVSMGIQVIEPDLLRVLNRSENGAAVHHRAVDHVRAAGFDRFNVDLMYGFAGQSPASWQATLEHAAGLDPEYVTLYRMRYKLTRISHQAEEVTLPDVRALSRLAKQVLTAAGYEANPGKTTYSRIPGDVGTSEYLRRRVVEGLPYLGFGLGAQSFTHRTVSYNDGAAGQNLAPYRRSVAAGRLPVQDLYDLPRRQVMGKFCAVSFYFGEIDGDAFQRKFGVSLGEALGPEVAFVLERDLMEWADGRLRLTAAGADDINGVIALFFAPAIQGWLLERDAGAAEDLRRNRRRAVAVAGER